MWYREKQIIDDPISDELDAFEKARKVTLPIQTDQARKGNKLSRILATVGYYERSKVVYHTDLKDTPDLDVLLAQLYECEPGHLPPHDDGPDAKQGLFSKLFRIIRSENSPPATVGQRTHRHRY